MNLSVEEDLDRLLIAERVRYYGYVPRGLAGKMRSPTVNMTGGSSAWGDAATIIPWNVYEFYGDRSILEQQFESMCAWVEYIRKTDDATGGKRLWTTGFHFGDWLIPSLTTGYNNPFDAANATKEITASCIFALSTELMSKIAQVLQKEDDRQRYSD